MKLMRTGERRWASSVRLKRGGRGICRWSATRSRYSPSQSWLSSMALMMRWRGAVRSRGGGGDARQVIGVDVVGDDIVFGQQGRDQVAQPVDGQAVLAVDAGHAQHQGAQP